MAGLAHHDKAITKLFAEGGNGGKVGKKIKSEIGGLSTNLNALEKTLRDEINLTKRAARIW